MTFGALGGFLRTPKNPPGYGPVEYEKAFTFFTYFVGVMYAGVKAGLGSGRSSGRSGHGSGHGGGAGGRGRSGAGECQLCAVCGRRFVDAAAFDRHVASSHAVGRPQRTHLCSVCGLCTSSAAALYRHSAVHVSADRRPLACAHCDRRFVRSGDLRKHVRVHSGDRPYQCVVCGRRFARSYSLLSHGRTHAAQSALRPCRTCRRTFKSAVALAIHRQYCV